MNCMYFLTVPKSQKVSNLTEKNSVEHFGKRSIFVGVYLFVYISISILKLPSLFTE